ncbi:hypothetical protein DVH24_025899 [Malus domestica]|uniref:Uncharacterized protein n=1 Tax=Malus domestica TaxID=3750 RepID=A0A498KN82_MALDO|nr:hypothetical protein DVH24_025899 [Malus domestica]
MPTTVYGTHCWAFKWFEYVHQRPRNAQVSRCNYEIEAQGKMNIKKPGKTWKETLRKYMEYLELMKNLTQI